MSASPTSFRSTGYVLAGGLLLGLAVQAGLWHALARSSSAPGAGMTQEMQVRLNGVSLSILGYLQSHRPEYLNALKADGQASTMLLKRFKNEASDAFPALTSRIDAAHNAQREATLAILNADNEQLQARATLEKERVHLLNMLDDKLSVNTRSSAARGSDRLRWLLTAIGEVKGFTPAAPDQAPAGLDGFQRAIGEYGRQTSGRQAAAIDDALRLWEACRASARQAADQEQIKLKALATFTRARMDLDQALDDYRRVLEPVRGAGASRSPRAAAWIWFGLSLGILGCGAVLALRVAMRRTRDEDALREIALCLDAAATGDLSRVPGPFAEPSLDRLSQSLGRLGTVVTRSENLVYHLAALVEMSGDAIVSQTLDGTILSWNKGAQRIYGYAVEEVRGHSIGILSPMDHGAELRAILERVKQGDKVVPFETLHQAKNGRLVRALVKAAAVHDSLHRVIGVSFCAQELTSPSTSSTAIPLTDTLQKS